MTLASPASAVASAKPIELRLGPSWHQASLLLAMHLGALVFLAPLAIPFAAKALFYLAIAASLAHTLYRHALRRGAGSVVRLRWDADGDWDLEDGNGRVHRARLAGASYTHPRLVVLNFRYRDDGRARSVVITPDALVSGNLRQLRVMLRLQGTGWGG